jgi:hypothetical protein
MKLKKSAAPPDAMRTAPQSGSTALVVADAVPTEINWEEAQIG